MLAQCFHYNMLLSQQQAPRYGRCLHLWPLLTLSQLCGPNKDRFTSEVLDGNGSSGRQQFSSKSMSAFLGDVAQTNKSDCAPVLLVNVRGVMETIFSAVLAMKAVREGSTSSLACARINHYQQTHTRALLKLGC